MTSRAGYWIGAGLIVAGVAGAILWGVLWFTAMGDAVDDFKRAPAPGMARVELEARKYIVYVEGPGVGRDHEPPVEILIVDRSGDGVLPLADYSASLTYSIGGHSGSAVATVTPPRAGVYSLRAATTSAPSAGLQVAVGDSIAGRIVRAILGAFAIGGLGLAAGIGLIVTTAVRRRRRGGAPPPSPPPPPPPPPSEHSGLAGLHGLSVCARARRGWRARGGRWRVDVRSEQKRVTPRPDGRLGGGGVADMQRYRRQTCHARCWTRQQTRTVSASMAPTRPSRPAMSTPRAQTAQGTRGSRRANGLAGLPG